MRKIYKLRRSIRKFKQKQVDKELLKEIIEDVRFAPSGNNKQALKYVVVTNKDTCDTIAENIIFAALLPRNIAAQKADERAAAYIVILEPEDGGRVQDIDMGIAADIITTSACEKGLGSCMMLNFNAEKISKILNISDKWKPAMVIPVGYPAHKSFVEDADRDGSTAYYTDENGDYHVPKKILDDITIWF